MAVACRGTAAVAYYRCDLTVSIEPAEGFPGDTIVVSGGPLTDAYDTLVTVAGVRAEVGEVSRDDCDLCDECKLDAACYDCQICQDCDIDCEDCTESFSFVVPDTAGGDTTVVISNSYGSSEPLTFVVLGNDGDTADTASDTAADTAPAMAATPPSRVPDIRFPTCSFE